MIRVAELRAKGAVIFVKWTNFHPNFPVKFVYSRCDKHNNKPSSKHLGYDDSSLCHGIPKFTNLDWGW